MLAAKSIRSGKKKLFADLQQEEYTWDAFMNVSLIFLFISRMVLFGLVFVGSINSVFGPLRQH